MDAAQIIEAAVNYQTIRTKGEPITPTVRRRTIDWLSLTNKERDVISHYLDGDYTIEDLTERELTYVRRHCGGR